MNATPPSVSPPGIVVLARLLVAGEKGEKLAKIRKDLEPLLQAHGAGSALTELVDQAIAALVAAGLVASTATKKEIRLTLTTDGQRRALALLGIDALPPKTTWAKLKTLYLPALALGLPGPKGPAAKSFGAKGGFEAAVLKAAFQLPLADFPDAKSVDGALIWKLLDINTSEPFSLPALKRHLYNQALGGGTSVNEKTGLRRLLTRAVDARRDAPPELREAVVRRWLAGRPVGHDGPAAPPATSVAAAPAAASPPLDLPAFAERVVEAARRCATGRFGDNKVFIAHVWRALQDDPACAGLDLFGFKRRLVDANRARLLDLSRADLVEAMNPVDVRESETLQFGASFHFIRV